jgi:beta-lactamase class A
MQSVFKLPLALTVLHQVEQGTFSLDQPVRFLPSDRILPHVYSPLQDQHPDGGVDVPLRELLRLDVSVSDNVAADILLRLVGGPTAVNTYIAGLGISGFHLEDSEAVLHREVSAQYRNWFEPAGAVQMLRRISDNSPLTSAHTDLLLGWMTSDLRTKRLEGDLPSGTRVAHKSGTSGVDNGVAHATNDIGLIPLPDGRRIAIAVFVTDSTADEATREQVIARIATDCV